MIKNAFLISGLFISTTLSAQITVTLSDMPNVSDSIIVSVASSIGASDPSLTGAGYSWDYSSLTPSKQQFVRFDSPQTFGTPFNYLFNSNNTSYGKNNYQFTTIPLPGANISSAYDFFKMTASELRQIGSGYTVNGIPIPFLYTSQDIIYNFPMDYLNVDSCDYKFGLPIPSLGYYGEKGHRVNIIDGWGAITTPFGTFQTLRVKSTISSIDTIYYSALSFGTNITRPLRYEYKWLATGMKIPVLEIDANVSAGTTSISNVMYIDSTRTGVPQVGIVENTASNLNVQVFPNPCVDKIMLQYSLSNTSKIKISITDLIGKKITDIVDETQISGTHQKLISLVDFDLTPGIYFLNLQTNNFEKTKKIVVAK